MPAVSGVPRRLGVSAINSMLPYSKFSSLAATAHVYLCSLGAQTYHVRRYCSHCPKCRLFLVFLGVSAINSMLPYSKFSSLAATAHVYLCSLGAQTYHIR